MKKTRLLSAFLAAVLAVSSTVLPASAEEAYRPGDLNGDSLVTVSDAILLARINAEDISVNVSSEGLAAADVNGDGVKDADDVSDILRYLAGLLPSLGKAEGTVGHVYYSNHLMGDYQPDNTLVGSAAEGFREAQMNFSANLLKETAKLAGTENNLLVSPYSVSMALGMTANGAKENTLAEMEQVLGGNLHMNDLNNSYLGIQQTPETTDIDGNPLSTLDIANAIWYHTSPERIVVPEDFLKTAADYFHADAWGFDRFGLETINDINYWVYENTHKMINRIIPDDLAGSDTVMVLVNALAFESEWEKTYTEHQVCPADFTLENGDKFRADLMYSGEDFYLETENAVGFKKFYKDTNYSFVGILPNEGTTVGEYLNELDGKELTTLMSGATTKYDLTVAIPRYTYDFSAKLNEPLQNMGIRDAFDPEKADFTGLDISGTLEQTYIGYVLHKTHIEVDDKGTKAAAATAVIMDKAASAAPQESRSVILDRPFVYMIYDEQNQLPIFIGTVMQPDAAKEETPAE